MTSLSEARLPPLLPVFYPNLDVAEIPTLQDFDEDVPASKVRTAITKGMVVALRGLDKIAELAWLGDPPSEREICVNLLIFVEHYHSHKQVAALLCTSPGLRLGLGHSCLEQTTPTSMPLLATTWHIP
ncbi:hypothetical protein FB451DRAFT_1183044 [Mycena latifolia]|nr:hypothetical protein FB451DRAFT_1183044 [Mycena latifolia]